MPQSLAQILVHLVFSTKNREAVLGDDIRDELHAYIGGIVENQKGTLCPATVIFPRAGILKTGSAIERLRSRSLAVLICLTWQRMGIHQQHRGSVLHGWEIIAGATPGMIGNSWHPMGIGGQGK